MSLYIKWLGNASVKIESDHTRILIDPFIEYPGGEYSTKVNEFIGDAVLITHGHVDHISSLPQVLSHYNMPVYMTKTPIKNMHKLTKDENISRNIREIHCLDEIDIGDFHIKVLPGKHIHFDLKLILKTLFSKRVIIFRKNLMELTKIHRSCPENKETVIYEITYHDTCIMVMGSLGVNDTYNYKSPDILLMTYQGNSHLEKHAKHVLEVLRPKEVIVTHFDDAFPPLSNTVDTSGLEEMIHSDFPHMIYIKPKINEPIIRRDL